MYDTKKSKDLIYYLSVLTKQELDKELKILIQYRKELPRNYREVFDFLVGNNKNKLSEEAEKIYRDLLK